MAGETVQFRAPLERFAELLDLNMQIVCRRLALEIFTGIIKRTPVDTGRARSNWNISVGGPDTSTSNLETPKNEKGKVIKKKGHYAAAEPDMGAIASIDGKEPIWISNNLDYIEFLEFGHSKQAPAGMVRLSVAEAEARISLIVKLLDK